MTGDGPGPGTGAPTTTPEAALWSCLREHLYPDPGTHSGEWATAAAYLRRHAARHAAAAGCLDPLVADAEFLVHAEPTRLALELTAAADLSNTSGRAVHGASYPVHQDVGPIGRRHILTMDAARLSRSALYRDLAEPLPWRVRWCTGSGRSTAIRASLLGHRSEVLTVATTALDGSPHAVSADAQGRVLVWDLATSTITRELTADSPSPDGRGDERPRAAVRAVSTVLIDTDPRVLVGGDDGWIEIWDPRSGVMVGQLPGHPGGVTATTAVTPGGRPHVISGGRDGVVRLWDLRAGNRGPTWAAPCGEIQAVAVDQWQGTHYAVLGDVQGRLQVRRLDNGAEVRTLDPIHERGVTAVSLAVLDGAPHAVTGDGRGTIRVWDLDRGIVVREISESHPDGVTAVAMVDGRPHAVTGGGDGVARVWDLTQRNPAIRELPGLVEGMTAVAVAPLWGRPHAVSGGFDGVVRIWDLTEPGRVGTAPGHRGHVRAAAVARTAGRNLGLTAGRDGRIRVWDLADGQPVREIPTGRTFADDGKAPESTGWAGEQDQPYDPGEADDPQLDALLDHLDPQTTSAVRAWGDTLGPLLDTDPDTVAVAQGQAAVPLRHLLTWIARGLRLDSRLTKRFVALFFPEVARYFSAGQRQAGARDRVRAEVTRVIAEESPRVVIGHSLGSVVAYEALHALSDPQVELFLTLGSPLALPKVVFDRLDPAPIDGQGQRPAGVGRWVNICDHGDPIAMPRPLKQYFSGVDVDLADEVGLFDFHRVANYLACSKTAATINDYL